MISTDDGMGKEMAHRGTGENKDIGMMAKLWKEKIISRKGKKKSCMKE